MIALLNSDARYLPLADQSVHCAITSPPYWGLRSYNLEPTVWGGDPVCIHEWVEAPPPFVPRRGNKPGDYSTSSLTNPDRQDRVSRGTQSGQWCHRCGAWRGCLGLEPTPDLYVEHIVACMREVWRVLRDDGTLWINLGDSYFGNGGQYGDAKSTLQGRKQSGTMGARRFEKRGLKPKDLCMIPARVALALQADGWYLRSAVPWVKRSSMPESVTDRPASSLEYVFMLAKRPRYYFDMEAVRRKGAGNINPAGANSRMRVDRDPAHGTRKQDALGKRTWTNFNDRWRDSVNSGIEPNGRSWRNGDLWFDSVGMLLADNGEILGFDVNPRPYSGAHFAVFPEDLIEPMVLAGTSARGCCPACGAPWVRVMERDTDYPDGHGLADSGFPKSDGVADDQNAHKRLHRRLKAARDAGEPHDNALGGVQTLGWIPSCSCYSIAVDIDKIEIPDKPEDAEPPFVCDGCDGTGLLPTLPMFPDDERPCPVCDGDPIREGNSIWQEWRAAVEAAQTERLRILKEVEGLDLPTVPAIVLDPFSGTATVGRVCARHGRRFVGGELNREYIALAHERTSNVQMELEA